MTPGGCGRRRGGWGRRGVEQGESGSKSGSKSASKARRRTFSPSPLREGAGRRGWHRYRTAPSPQPPPARRGGQAIARRLFEPSMPPTLTRDEIADRLAEVGYIADPDLATALLLMDMLEPAAADRRRGRRRQDRGGQGAGRRARHQPDPAAMLRGAGPVRRAVRVELPAPIARHQGARGRRRGRDRGGDLLGALPAGPPAAGGHPAGHGTRAADRRDRPGGPGVRGIPAGTCSRTSRCRSRNLAPSSRVPSRASC